MTRSEMIDEAVKRWLLIRGGLHYWERDCLRCGIYQPGALGVSNIRAYYRVICQEQATPNKNAGIWA